MKRKILSAVLSAALLLTGCQAGTSGASGGSIGASSQSVPEVNMEETDEFIIYRPPYTPDWLRDAIVLFRQVYRDVKVTIVDFSTSGTYEERCEQYQNRINNELMAGEGPDIIFPAYLSMNPYKAMQENYYLNLTPFFEQDKYFSEDDFLPGVFDAGQYQGRQYIVPINVDFPMYIARTPVLEKLGISRDEPENVASFLRQTGEKAQQAQIELGYDHMMFETMYYGMFLTYANLKLIDYENRQVCPEPEKVRDFMEAYKTYYKWDYNDGEFSRGRFEDNIPFLPANFCYANLLDHVQCLVYTAPKFLYADGSYTDFFLRDMDGKVNSRYIDYIAVPVTSKNQLNAYRFIQLMLSASIQEKQRNNSAGGFLSPVNREVVESQIRAEMNNIPQDYYRDGTIVGTIDPIPSTDLLEHIEKLRSIDSSVMPDSTVMRMTWQTMQPFFKDERSYESCFDELKSKLTIYMDE